MSVASMLLLSCMAAQPLTQKNNTKHEVLKRCCKAKKTDKITGFIYHFSNVILCYCNAEGAT